MAYDIGPKIGIQGEAEFRNQLYNITATLKALDKEMEATTTAFGENENSQESLIVQNRILTRQIELQKKKVEELKKGLNDSSKEYGENDTKTQKWRTSVNQATADLNRMEQKLSDNEKALEFMGKNAGLSAEKVKELKDRAAEAQKEFDEFASSIRGKVSSGFKTLATGAVAAATGIVATVEGTAELRGDLSKLSANAKSAGVGFDVANDALLNFNAISGETDSSIEAISNLLKAGFDENNLAQAVEALSGAVIQFPDTLKIESLADSLQETLATSEATGQFGELLERLGYNLDDFNSGLKECTSSTDKQRYALQYLADGGLNRATQEYNVQNEALIENSKQQLKLKENLAEVGENFAPLVNRAMEAMNNAFEKFNQKGLPMVTDGLEWMMDNGDTVISVLGGLTTGVIAYKTASVVTDAIGGFQTLTKAINAAKAAQTALNLAQLASPVGLAVGAFTALAAGITLYASTAEESAGATSELGSRIEETRKKIEELNASISESDERREDTKKSIDAEITANKNLVEQLEELTAIENKSRSEKYALKNVVDQLNAAMPELGLNYDMEADAVNRSTSEVRDYISALETKYRIQAAEQDLSSIIQNQYEAQKNLAMAQNDYNDALEIAEAKQKEMNDAIAEGTNRAPEYAAAVDYANAELEEATKNVEEAKKAVDEQGKLAQETTEFIEKYTEENKKAGESLAGLGTASEEASTQMSEDLQKLQEEYEKTRESAQNSIDSQLGLFDEINAKSDLTIYQMIERLKQQATATANWADNLKIAAERGVDQGLLKKLADAGPESAGYLQVIANATDEEIEEMNRAWRDRFTASEYAAEEMAAVQTEIDRSKPGITNATSAVGAAGAMAYASGALARLPQISSAGGKMRDTLAASSAAYSALMMIAQQSVPGYSDGANSRAGLIAGAGANLANIIVANSGAYNGMYTQGQSAGQGYIDGVSSKIAAAAVAGANVAIAAMNAAKKAQNSNSPSKEFKKIGRDGGMGYGLGFEESMNDVRPRITRSIQQNLDAAKIQTGGQKIIQGNGLTQRDITRAIEKSGIGFYVSERELARIERRARNA